jgi:hypothetical protein
MAFTTAGSESQGLMLAMAYSVTGLTFRRQLQQFNWRGRRSRGQELYQAQAELLSVTTAFGQS